MRLIGVKVLEKMELIFKAIIKSFLEMFKDIDFYF